MLVMPILVTSSKDKSKNKIYNVRVSLNKDRAYKEKEDSVLKGIGASDILLNGKLYSGNSEFVGDAPSVIRFIRNNNYDVNSTHFLVTTDYNIDSDTYDVYKVENLPRKITAGLDNLYGEAIIDMMREIPGEDMPTYLDLRKIGLDSHITDEKLETLDTIMKSDNSLDRKKEIMLLNGVGAIYNTLDYIKCFDFEAINSIYEDDIKNAMDYFEKINCRISPLDDYYSIACNNREVYKKLNRISKIVNSKALSNIKNKETSKVLLKRPEE